MNTNILLPIWASLSQDDSVSSQDDLGLSIHHHEEELHNGCSPLTDRHRPFQYEPPSGYGCMETTQDISEDSHGEILDDNISDLRGHSWNTSKLEKQDIESAVNFSEVYASEKYIEPKVYTSEKDVEPELHNRGLCVDVVLDVFNYVRHIGLTTLTHINTLCSSLSP